MDGRRFSILGRLLKVDFQNPPNLHKYPLPAPKVELQTGAL